EPFSARPGIPADHPRIVAYEYDEAGRLAAAHAFLSGTLPLDRHHEDPAGVVAPPPPGASHDGVALLGRYHYDEFDNIARVELPAGSSVACQTIHYDYDFAQLPVGHAAYRAAGCEDPISQTYSWDRGLEVRTRTTQPSGAVSTAIYDGFGRFIEAHDSDPV